MKVKNFSFKKVLVWVYLTFMMLLFEVLDSLLLILSLLQALVARAIQVVDKSFSYRKVIKVEPKT